MKTGNTDRPGAGGCAAYRASMEPGHEDREYGPSCAPPGENHHKPQWSPVMKTGNTGHVAPHAGAHAGASMEPGHEDREYEAAHDANPTCSAPQWSPVMKTGNT